MNESNISIARVKRLLEWNSQKLTSHSDLALEDLPELFAPKFIVLANGRKYDANHHTYYAFLTTFRSTIDSITYHVQEYLNTDSTVVMPLQATIKRIHGTEDIFYAMLLIKFNAEGKINHWQEVYCLSEPTTL